MVVLADESGAVIPCETLAILEHICDIASITISQTIQILQSTSLATQLQKALESRVVLEQAKGVLAERMKIDFVSAFQEIRNSARREQRPVHHVAADIIAALPYVAA